MALQRFDLHRTNGEILFDSHRAESVLNAAARLKPSLRSVVRDTLRFPGADIHDYMSIAPYWFDNGEGQWVRHDGIRNPLAAQWQDKKSLNGMVRDISLLALAEHLHTLTQNDSAASADAQRMESLLRVWFLDEETRMNPNMTYAQVIPDTSRPDRVRGSGIVELRVMIDLIESVELVSRDGRLDDRLLAGLRLWFSEMTDWLLQSPQGRKERSAQNNHGTWYDAQVLTYAHFCGRTELIAPFQDELKTRLLNQIDENGTQTHEMERTNSLSYCCFNLLAYAYARDALSKAGVDAEQWSEWHRVTAAYDRIRPYAENTGNGWPAQQIRPFEPREWLILFR